MTARDIFAGSPACSGVGQRVPYFDVRANQATCPTCGCPAAVLDDRDGSVFTIADHPGRVVAPVPTLKIGGPVAIRCDTCRQPPGAGCVLLDKPDGRPIPWPRKRPHAARVKAAPPEAEVREGDLVIVSYYGERLAALFVVPRDNSLAVLRFWAAGGFEAPRALPAWRILRLAPEDERTAAARAALQEGRVS